MPGFVTLAVPVLPPEDPGDSEGRGRTIDVDGKGRGGEDIVSDGLAAVDDEGSVPEEPPA